MSELDAFERRLARAFDAIADGMPVDVDPGLLAIGLIRRGRPRLLGGWLALPDRTPPFGARWVTVAILLLAATLLAVASFGILPRNLLVVDTKPSPTPFDVPSIDPARPVPIELAGGWEQTGTDALSSGDYLLDFEAPALVVRWDGVRLHELGRATAYEAIDALRGRVTIAASGACGIARYDVTRSGRTGDPRPEIYLSNADDPCDARRSILGPGPWLSRWEPGAIPPALVPGRSYDSGSFGEAFHYVASDIDPDWGRPVAWNVAPRGDLSIESRPGGWSLRFLDDVPVLGRPCDPDGGGTLDDVPSSPDAVARWLGASPELVAGNPRALEVDGRTALRFDIAAIRCDNAPLCQQCRPPYFVSGLWNSFITPIVVIYAIPTGDDTILAIGSGDAGSSPRLLENGDRLIASITFD